MVFGYDLAFVVPTQRNRGIGQFLTAAICMWMQNCRVTGARVVRDGVTVIVSGEVYSVGGEKLGRIVLEQFTYLHECRGDKCFSPLAWKIREVHDELKL